MIAFTAHIAPWFFGGPLIFLRRADDNFHHLKELFNRLNSKQMVDVHKIKIRRKPHGKE